MLGGAPGLKSRGGLVTVLRGAAGPARRPGRSCIAVTTSVARSTRLRAISLTLRWIAQSEQRTGDLNGARGVDSFALDPGDPTRQVGALFQADGAGLSPAQLR